MSKLQDRTHEMLMRPALGGYRERGKSQAKMAHAEICSHVTLVATSPTCFNMGYI